MTHGTLLTLMISLPFAGSLIAGILPSRFRNAEYWLSGIVTFAVFASAIYLYPQVAEQGVLRQDIEWLPLLGLNFTIRLDGFAWLFTVLVTGIGLLVILYARYYMAPEDPIARFFSLFLGFMGAMLGIILSGNLILLVMFWELTSIFSFLLVGYWYHNASARDGARMALMITATGGLCLLAGVLVIGHIVGSYDLDVVLNSGEAIRSSPLYVPALVLFMLGTLTKSAQFPFHFWLPNAMAAPTPVSAFLHSATMVKAGVFLMARFWPVMAGTPEWFWILGLAGMASLVLGAYFSIFQQDIKGLLAYSTISHLGLITMLLSFGSPLGAVAAIFHMVNHAIFKASLFMAAGIIDHETGSRDIRKLSGLFRFMPITATLAMVASAAMAGVPLMNGFLSKEMFFAEAIATHEVSILDTIAPYAAVVASIFAVTYSIRFIQGVFFGPPPVDLPRVPHEPPFLMRLPIQFLVMLCLIIGIVPNITIGKYLHLAASSVLGAETPVYNLAVWHGFTLPMIMSLVALALGILLFMSLRNYLAHCHEGPPFLRHIRGQRIFDRIMVALSWRWARWMESQLGTKRLQPQVRLIVLLSILVIAWPLYTQSFTLGEMAWHGADITFAGMWIVGGICAISAAYLAKFHRLAALIMLGGAGLITCLTFVWLSAPDLAVTQLLVEVVTTVLLLLGLRWLPKRKQFEDPGHMVMEVRIRRLADLFIAIATGAGMTLLAYAVMTRTPPTSIASYFLEKAYVEGGGRNVVNVILVDFRGFDTFGEITVLGIVALTVYSLLRRFRPAPDSLESPEQQRIQTDFDEERPDRSTGETLSDYLYVPAVTMQWLFPVIMVLAAYLFLRGHDLPGGGFAAGVAMASAFILQYLSAGTRWVEERLRVLPVYWIGSGLLTAALVGAGSWVFGYPFLTTHTRYINIPLIGDVPAASATLFDFGVFTLVVGATVLMLIAIAHQSIRRLRAAKLAMPADEEAA